MRTRAAVAAAVLVLGLPALAVKVNEKLYVKAKNTRVLASPSPTADVVTVLQPGEQVTWGGADAKHKQWHKVTGPGGKTGFTFQTNLSTQPPSMELVVDKDGKRKLDSKGFVASGAAVKALSPAAIEYGRGKDDPDFGKAVDDILLLEGIAKKVEPQQLAAHAAQAGLFPVVGPQGARPTKGGR
jgi:hypothetical protein